MTTLEILRTARDKIANPENWTRREYARDEEGDRVAYDSDYACSWCAAGAVRTVSKTYSGTSSALDALKRELPRLAYTEFDLALYNDTRTHSEVLALFDRAIERAERKYK